MPDLTRDEIIKILAQPRWIRDASGNIKCNISFIRFNLWRLDLKGLDFQGVNLTKANLGVANLRAANLSMADLSGAHLFGADLQKANLRAANLFGANLSMANLSGADLRMANLQVADLSGANLWGANLSEANLSEADLQKANLQFTNLLRANLLLANTFRTDFFGAVLDKAYQEKTIKKKQTISTKKSTTKKINLKPSYLFFDTETTGLPRNFNAPISDFNNWPRLVQLAWLLYDSEGKLIKKKESIIKPQGFRIPKGSSDVHGITTEYALSNGRTLIDVLDEFKAVCEKSKLLIAHNMNFDSKIMGSEFLRNNYNNPISNLNKVCTMETTTDFCKIQTSRGYKYPSLDELHQKLFSKGFKDAHNALADVEATARCFWELRKRNLITL